MSLRISHGASLVTSRESGIDCFSRTPMKNEGKERKHSGARVLPVSKQDKHVATNFQPSFLYTLTTHDLARFPFTIPFNSQNVLRNADVAKTATLSQSHSNSPHSLTSSLPSFTSYENFALFYSPNYHSKQRVAQKI